MNSPFTTPWGSGFLKQLSAESFVQSFGSAQRLWTACSELRETTAFAKHKHFNHSGIRPKTRARNSGKESIITHHSSLGAGVSFAVGEKALEVGDE